MGINIIERVAGSTLKSTWVNSGVTANPISSAILDRNETLINSVAATSSGGGFYYALHALPTTPNVWYVNQWIAYIGANTYVDRQFVKATRPEVD